MPFGASLLPWRNRAPPSNHAVVGLPQRSPELVARSGTAIASFKLSCMADRGLTAIIDGGTLVSKAQLRVGLSALSMFAALAVSAQTTTPSDCMALWNEADASASGALTKQQAQPFVTDFTAVDTDKDGKISNAEFMVGCSAGQVRKMNSASGAIKMNLSYASVSGAGAGSSGPGSSGSVGAQPMPSL